MPKAPELNLVLNLAGLRVLIAGAGNVAAQKLKALPAGVAVKVISPRMGPGLKRKGVTLLKRAVRPSDVDGADLIFAATNNPAVNAALARRALKKRRLVSVADQPALGNFSLPALAKAGAITLSVSTSGASPAVARALKVWLLARLRGSRLLKLTAELGRRRAWLKAHPAEKDKLLRGIRNPRAFSKLLS